MAELHDKHSEFQLADYRHFLLSILKRDFRHFGHQILGRDQVSHTLETFLRRSWRGALVFMHVKMAPQPDDLEPAEP